MRILISGQTYVPDANGQAIFTTNLAEGLVQKEHQVMVLVPSDTLRTRRESRKGVELGFVPAFSLAPWYPSVHITPLPSPSVRRFFEEFQPDIVHIQDHYFLSRSVARTARKRGLPVIGTNHFLPANLSRNLFIPSMIRPRVIPSIERAFWRNMLSLYNKLDLITTPTSTAARILLEQNVLPPVEPVSCGVNLSLFRPETSANRIAIRRRYGLEVEKALFVFVGRVDYEKRLDVLLHAFALLDRDDVQLAIAGKGLHLLELWKLAKELRLGEKVRFLGFVPGEDLPSLLTASDAFVMPSEAELQSIATLEAMAAGLPVLAADAGALPELVTNGTNGYLFRAGDANDAAARITLFLDERDRWPEMGEASMRKAAPHGLDTTVRRYEELYGSLVESHALAPAAKHIPLQRHGSVAEER